MSVAEQLGAFLASTDTADLPAQSLDHAGMLVASTIASAAFGSTLRSAQIMRTLARERGGTPDASVWFDEGERLPVGESAQVNALTSDAAASDDSDLRNIVHPGTALAASSLAMAERVEASGAAVLTAIVLGYEAAGRLGEAITPGFLRRGFHGCLGAIYGAGVAAGYLLDLDADCMGQTIALAATSIGGLMVAANTSTAREYHAGLATLLGVNAALAAHRGYRTETSVLEAPHGFFEAFGDVDGSSAAEQALSDLGESWDIDTDMAIKLMPGGHPSHAIAEAAAAAASKSDIATDDIEAIVIARPGLSALTGPLHPTDLIAMAHSQAYFAAAGVADRELSWTHATQAKIDDPLIHRLIDRVRVGDLPSGVDPARYRQGASVTIHARDGRISTATVYRPKGSAMEVHWADVDFKYRALTPAAGLSNLQIEESLDCIHRLQELPLAGELTPLLVVKGP